MERISAARRAYLKLLFLRLRVGLVQALGFQLLELLDGRVGRTGIALGFVGGFLDGAVGVIVAVAARFRLLTGLVRFHFLLFHNVAAAEMDFPIDLVGNDVVPIGEAGVEFLDFFLAVGDFLIVLVLFPLVFLFDAFALGIGPFRRLIRDFAGWIGFSVLIVLFTFRLR